MSTDGPSDEANQSSRGRRKQDNLRKLSHSTTVGRFAIVNYFGRTVDALAPTTKFPKIKAFLSSQIWPWILGYLKYVFTPRVRFRTYTGSNKNGVYRIKPRAGAKTIRIALAGDWGTGTDEAWTIAKLMSETNPDFTIHLGDIYYVGDSSEIEENFLGKSTGTYDGVRWPKGEQGSFALNGNHEMYANGGPYFNTLLTSLGMQGDPHGQEASYFCLETEKWRVLAIDTAYNSIGVPILSVIPWINNIPFIGGNCHIEQSVLDWLKDVVRVMDHPKPTLLLSHHQYFTAFNDHFYTVPAKQLAKFLAGQEIVWMWGHEHRLAIYDQFKTPEGMTMHGRCVGHGGMPIEMHDPDPSVAPIGLYDTRTHTLDDGSPVGLNGFVSITIEGDELTVEYRDIGNIRVLTEKFSPGVNGTLQHKIDDPGILVRSSR